MECLGRMGCLVNLDGLVTRVTRENPESQAMRVRLDRKEMQETWDYQVHSVPRGLRVQWAPPDIQGLRVRTGRREIGESQERQGWESLDHLEPRVRLDCLVSLATQERRVQRVVWVCQECQGPQVPKETQAALVTQVSLVSQVKRGLLVFLGQEGNRDGKDSQVSQAYRAPQVRLERKARQA